MYTYVVLLFWKSSRTSSIKKSSNGTNYFVIGSNKENSFKLSVKQTPGTASDEVTWSSNQESKGITIDENGIVKVDYKQQQLIQLLRQHQKKMNLYRLNILYIFYLRCLYQQVTVSNLHCQKTVHY